MVEISKETITLYGEVDQVRIKRITDHNLDGSFSLQEDSNTRELGRTARVQHRVQI